MVMEVIIQEQRGGLSWEILYVDDLNLTAYSEEGLCEKTVKWKSGLEVGLKTNTKKQK